MVRFHASLAHADRRSHGRSGRASAPTDASRSNAAAGRDADLHVRQIPNRPGAPYEPERIGRDLHAQALWQQCFSWRHAQHRVQYLDARRTQPCLCKADATRCHTSIPRVGAFLAVFRNVSGPVNTRCANLLADFVADWQTVDRWLTGIRRVFECACDDRTNAAGSGRRRRNPPRRQVQLFRHG